MKREDHCKPHYRAWIMEQRQASSLKSKPFSEVERELRSALVNAYWMDWKRYRDVHIHWEEKTICEKYIKSLRYYEKKTVLIFIILMKIKLKPKINTCDIEWSFCTNPLCDLDKRLVCVMVKKNNKKKNIFSQSAGMRFLNVCCAGPYTFHHSDTVKIRRQYITQDEALWE